MSTVHDTNKALVTRLRDDLSSGNEARIRTALRDSFAPDATIRLGHPFGDQVGPEALLTNVYAPLLAALPDMECADFILMAGPRWGAHLSDDLHGNWVGVGCNILGTFASDWLGIRATGRPVHMRAQEYFKIEDGRITHMEALWDIPQLMLQAGVWPMAAALAPEWMCPGPMSGHGLVTGARDDMAADRSAQTVWDMLHDLKQGTADTPDRGLGGFWHPNAMWYGPTGLGTARGHRQIAQDIFRQFREGLLANTRHLDEGVFFAEGRIVAFTGWPSGTARHSADGFLGLPPTGKRITRRSLDFWTVEDGMIRECWVMVDMLDLYRQLGVDVLARATRVRAA